MTTDIKTILRNMVVLGILVFAIFSFILTVQLDSGLNSAQLITNNSVINESFGYLQSNLSQQTGAENALNSLEDVPPTEYVGDLNVGSTVSATRTARAIIVGTWNVMIKLPIVILGVSPVVAGAVTSILLIFIAIGIWAIWKGAIQ
ncbi:hypothetical protein LCGC14_1475930 [marine sediment metagenome]|uniref:Uncharacterized protein n=1 Tax=marine sediment metagenome TaxID=412755 RepID=A0A0F9MCP1_9ZZZZ